MLFKKCIKYNNVVLLKLILPLGKKANKTTLVKINLMELNIEGTALYTLPNDRIQFS